MPGFAGQSSNPGTGGQVWATNYSPSLQIGSGIRYTVQSGDVLDKLGFFQPAATGTLGSDTIVRLGIYDMTGAASDGDGAVQIYTALVTATIAQKTAGATVQVTGLAQSMASYVGKQVAVAIASPDVNMGLYINTIGANTNSEAASASTSLATPWAGTAAADQLSIFAEFIAGASGSLLAKPRGFGGGVQGLPGGMNS